MRNTRRLLGVSAPACELLAGVACLPAAAGSALLSAGAFSLSLCAVAVWPAAVLPAGMWLAAALLGRNAAGLLACAVAAGACVRAKFAAPVGCSAGFRGCAKLLAGLLLRVRACAPSAAGAQAVGATAIGAARGGTTLLRGLPLRARAATGALRAPAGVAVVAALALLAGSDASAASDIPSEQRSTSLKTERTMVLRGTHTVPSPVIVRIHWPPASAGSTDSVGKQLAYNVTREL